MLSIFFIFGFYVKFWHHKPKGSVRYILLVCFSSLKESTSKTWKSVFNLLRKLFSFPRKSIKILDIQVSLNKKYILVNNLGSKQNLVMKIGQFVYYCKRKKFIKKLYKNWNLKTSSRSFYVCQDFYWKINFLKRATYIRYVLAKLWKFVQFSTLTYPDSFLQRLPWKLKRPWN